MKVKNMEKAISYNKIKTHTRENGYMANKKALESKHILMEKQPLVNLETIS